MFTIVIVKKKAKKKMSLAIMYNITSLGKAYHYPGMGDFRINPDFRI